MKLLHDKKILLLLLCVLIALLALNAASPFLLWDENAYLGNARSHIAPSYFTEDFRYPLLEYVIAFLWLFTGESVFMAKLLIMLFTLGSVLVFYHIAERHFAKRGFFITVIFSLSPMALYWGNKVYADIPSLFFILLSYYLLLGEKRDSHIVLAGIASASAFLMRFPAGIFPFAVGIYLTIHKKFRSLVLFSLGCTALLAPWLLYNYMNYANPLWDFLAQWTIVDEYTLMQSPLLLFLNIGIAVHVLLLFLPASIYIIGKDKTKRDSCLLLCIFLIVFLLVNAFVFKMKLTRYVLIALPFFYLLCFEGFVLLAGYIERRWRKHAYTAAVSSMLLFICLAVLANGIAVSARQSHCESDGVIVSSVAYIKERTIPGQHVLSNFWPWFGYGANLRASSLWSEDISSLVGQYNTSYVIFSDDVGGTAFDKAILETSEALDLEKLITDRCGRKAFVYRVR